LLLSSLAWPKPHIPCVSCRPECQQNILSHWLVFVWSCSPTMVRASDTCLGGSNKMIFSEVLRQVKTCTLRVGHNRN
jgi:hypothetical protein